jgi:tRNA uridine 5-carboxymethylaminomethyl modification enzyme
VNPRILEAAESERVIGQAIEREYSLADLLRRPGVEYDKLMTLKGVDGRELAGPGETMKRSKNRSKSSSNIRAISTARRAKSSATSTTKT